MLTSLPSYLVIMGYISHMLLLLGGLLTLFRVKRYPLKAYLFTYIFLALTFIFAYLVKIKVFYPDANNLDSLVIIKLIDGSILSYIGVTYNEPWLNTLVTILVYVVLTLFTLMMNLINYKNSKCNGFCP